MQRAVVATSDKLMTDYHRILELPKHATEEQIRTQYKRLVRIYHPDRFTNAQDKIYVEEKLREINQAYEMLLARTTNSPHESAEPERAPQPTVMPAALDFGTLVKHERKALLFQLQNSGGPVQNFQLDYSEDSNWFKVMHGRRLHKKRPFPMEFSVVIDTSRLEPQEYSGWIQVSMDKTALHIPVRATVEKPRFSSFFTPRIAFALTLLALVVLMLAFQLSDFALPIFSLSSANSSSSTSIANSGVLESYSTPVPLGEDIDLVAAIVISPSTTINPISTFTTMPTVSTPTSSLQGRVGMKEEDLQDKDSSAQNGTIPIGTRPVESSTPLVSVQRANIVPTVQLAISSQRAQMTAATTALVSPPISPTMTVKVPPVLTLSSTPVTVAITSATGVDPATVISAELQTTIATSLPTIVPTTTKSPTATTTLTPLTALPISSPIAPPSPSLAISPTASVVPSLTMTASPTATPSPTASPSPTATPSSTATPSPTVTSSSTATSLPSATPSITPSITPSLTSSPTMTPYPTVTPYPTPSSTRTPIPISTVLPTATPSPTVATATPVIFSQTGEGTTAIRIPANYNVNARADISVNATVVQILPSETEWIAVGRTIDATWLYIALSQGQFAWVYTETILVDDAAVNTLPIVVPASFQ